MANSVTIRTTAPGAKEAAGQLGMLKAQVVGLGSSKAGPLGGLTSGMGGAGLAMLGAVGAGVAIGQVLEGVGTKLGDAANMAIADQKSVLSLNTALRENVPSWDGSTAAIDRATQAGIDLGFADDDSRASIQKLVIATGDITKSLHLYSLAQDIARGRNIDLSTATDIVTKANMGNVGALRRMGIEVDKNATSVEILATLQQKYAGQSETFATSQAGKLEVVNQKWDEMQESVGYGVMPAIEGFTDYVSKTLLPGLGNLGNAVSDVFNPQGKGDRISAGAQAMADKIAEEYAKATDRATAFIESQKPKVQEAVNQGYTRPTLAEMAHMREEAGREAHSAGIQITDDLAGALSGNKDVVSTAMDKVKFAITHPMQQTRELARIEGALTSTMLANGMNSTNPAVRAIAREQQQILLDQWQSITGSAYSYGAAAARQYVHGLNSVSFHVDDPFKDPGRDPGHKGPGGKASGGDLAPGELSWVGENGPELIRPGQGAHVFSNAQSKGMMGGGNINVQVSLSTREFARASRHNSVIQAGGPSF